MPLTRYAFAIVLFVVGLGIGALWSPRGDSPQLPSDNEPISAARAQKNKEHLAHIKESLGEEAAELASQGKDLTIRVKQYPIDARASRDGRFTIGIFGSDETIASDLRYPAAGDGVDQLVRHYSYSCGNRSYSCDFGRSMKDSTITETHFTSTDAEGNELVYVDSDGDGRWDRFTELSPTTVKGYARKDLCWEIVTDEAR